MSAIKGKCVTTLFVVVVFVGKGGRLGKGRGGVLVVNSFYVPLGLSPYHQLAFSRTSTKRKTDEITETSSLE